MMRSLVRGSAVICKTGPERVRPLGHPPADNQLINPLAALR
jgi:hypothetical protein